MSRRRIVPLDEIVIDDTVNPREILDLSAVQDYSTCISELPRMGAYDIDGVGYVLTRGFHRIESHKMAGMEEAEFNIFSGTMQEARRDAYLHNLPNGVRLTHSERKRVYRFEISSNPYRSDTDIATICKTSVKKIKGLRKELESESKIPAIQPSLIPIGNNEDGKRTLLIDPKRVERPWFQRRVRTTLAERMIPCHSCSWPISQRAHLLDVAAWGENPHTRQLCSNCHELYDIMVAEIEEKGTRSEVLLRKYIIELGEDNEVIVSLSELAQDMVQVRDTLRRNFEEGVKHRELAH